MSITTVIASRVDKVNLYFDCPYCWSHYNKDGSPSKRAKRVVHKHGSGGNMANRVESRSSHCSKDIYGGQFEIHIDNNTIRS